MSPLKTIGYCLREYPLLTMVGAYGLLYTAGDFIATVVYNEPDYVFGDATALILDTAEAGLLEFGNISSVALRRLFGHDARDTAAFGAVIQSFFRQAAALLQRCLDRDIISVEEAEAAADAGDELTTAHALSTLSGPHLGPSADVSEHGSVGSSADAPSMRRDGGGGAERSYGDWEDSSETAAVRHFI